MNNISGSNVYNIVGSDKAVIDIEDDNVIVKCKTEFSDINIYNNVTGYFKNVDINCSGSKVILNKKCNIYADTVKSISATIEYEPNVDENIEIDIFSKNIKYMYLAVDTNEKRLAGYINTHGTIINELYYEGKKRINVGSSYYISKAKTWIALNKDSINEDTKLSNQGGTDDWQTCYNDLHFADISDDYVDYINLFIGNAWKKILLYDEGDIPFYIDKNTVLYMKFDGSVDENTRDALVYFPTANNIKAGRIIKTIDNNDL